MKTTALVLALTALAAAPALAGGMAHASPKPSPGHMMTGHHMASHHATKKSDHMVSSHMAAHDSMKSTHMTKSTHMMKKPTPKPTHRP